MEVIITKICSKCKQNLSIENYTKDKTKVDGVKIICKPCSNINTKKYYTENKENAKLVNKIYHKENIESIRIRKSRYYKNNKEQFKKTSKVWRENNHTEIKRKYRIWSNEKYKTNSRFRFIRNSRSRIKSALGNKKRDKTIDLFCTSLENTYIHLEKQFKDGMTWDNYGKVWQVDHIIPLAFFDISDATEQRIANHWGNLQPLFVKENLKKGDKILEKTNFIY